MNAPTIKIKEINEHVIEIITTEDVEIHQSYLALGYPENKVLEGAFLQLVKGNKQCEGNYQNGKKNGRWAYYINNPYHPAVYDYYESGRLVKKEVFHQDGHHLLLVMTHDEKERPLKRILYAEDGKTIIRLDIFQNGLLKEENVITKQGQEQVVYQYDAVFKLVEKRHFVNDELTKVEKVA